MREPVSQPFCARRPLLLGHRGTRRLRRFGLHLPSSSVPPENTLAAFEYALAHGCDGFEFDVRYTCDRRKVLWHDEKVRGKHIAQTDYAGLDHRHVTTACLEDVLLQFGQTAFLDIELKVQGEEEEIAAELRAHPPRRYVVSSFLPEVLLKLQALDGGIPLGYLCKRTRELPCWRELPIQVLLPHHRLMSRALVEHAHQRGVQVMTWTVNRRSEMLRLAQWGVDGIISDSPRLLSDTFPAWSA